MALQRLHYIATGFVAILVACAGLIFFQERKAMPLVHKLKGPLLLSGAGTPNQTYVLPAGTALYYDQAFPEGFVRYKVYINVEGIKLESTETTDKFWLDPLTAFPPNSDELRKLLSSHPLSKSDLAGILGSGVLSKSEIRELLEEFSR